MRLVAGKTFVYCGLYTVFSMFLLGLLPHFFSIPNIGNGLYITAMMVPYLMATSFFGLAASRYFTDSEAPLLMIAFFSVGLIFLSGVSYPLELMPWYWRMAHYILPKRTRHACFRQAKLDGSRYGRHTAGIHYTVDTGDRLFRTQRVGIQEKAGSVNQKREPFPNSEITPICPPIFSIMLLHRGSPNPVPCTKLSTFIKRSKTAS